MNDLSEANGLEAALAQVKSMVQQGMEQFDPTRLCFIESMVLRSVKPADCKAAANLSLEKRIFTELEQYRQDFNIAKKQAALALEKAEEEFPNSSDAMRQLFSDNDFKAVMRRAQALESGKQAAQKNQVALSELIDSLLTKSESSIDSTPDNFEEQLALQESEVAHLVRPSTPSYEKAGELKSIRSFRQSWTKENSEKVVDHSIEQCPRDAGPLNQENLAIRTLSILREMSPEYMSRFVTYVDTLLWLEQFNKKTESKVKTKKTGKKTKK